MEDPLAALRVRFLTLAADIPARCCLVERSEGNTLVRKVKKLALFRGRYLRWAAARAGLRPGVVELPLFWGGVMRLPYADDADFVTFYLAGAPGGPEYKLVRWLIRNLRPGDAFYDAGASYGFYTMLAAEFVGAGGEIHAFEPLPETCGWLTRNAPGPIAHIVNAALWDSSGTAALFRHPTSDSFSTLEPGVAAGDPSRFSSAEVRCVTLDEYAKDHRSPTVIKIDVEGGEKRLIAGGRATLETARPRIAMEVWGGAQGERFSLPACRALFDLGYTAHALTEDGETTPLAASALAAHLSMVAIWDNLVFLPT